MQQFDARHLLAGLGNLEAIRTNRFAIDKPVIKTYALQGEAPLPGKVYVARSKTRPGELKLGYTTMNLVKRAQLFRSKYGYADFRIIAHVSTKNPALLENLVQAELRSVRVCGNVKGDSNEWYRLGVVRFKLLVEQVARAHSLSVYQHSWAR